MSKVELSRPLKEDQCAALMLTVFKANPGVVMTRREVESLVNVSEFSVSTRCRALNVLVYQGHLSDESNWPFPTPVKTYWLSADALANAG